MKNLKEDYSSYNWENSKGDSVSDLLVIEMKTWDNVGFQFYQTVLIHTVLEATCMDHFNGFTTPTKVDSHLDTDKNGPESKKYWPNSYASVS